MTKQCSSCGGFCAGFCQRTSDNKPSNDSEEVALLKRCLDEMRDAGWNEYVKISCTRWKVFSAVLNYLHQPVESKGD